MAADTDHDRAATGAPAAWDAATYHRVSDPHVRWAVPLLDRLRLAGDETVVDAGCGTGRVTAELLARLPHGRVVAVDRDAAMLAEARAVLGALPGGERVRYVRADLLDLDAAVGEPADRVLSTATFHWVTDHDRLFAALSRTLRPGGRLVAQCGGAGNIARLLGHVDAVAAADPTLAPRLAGWPGPWHFSGADEAAGRLRAAGFEDVETALVDAPVTLPDAGRLTEFLRSVVLGEHLARLPDDAARERLLAAVTARVAGEDPALTLDYVRLNLAARRPAG